MSLPTASERDANTHTQCSSPTAAVCAGSAVRKAHATAVVCCCIVCLPAVAACTGHEHSKNCCHCALLLLLLPHLQAAQMLPQSPNTLLTIHGAYFCMLSVLLLSTCWFPAHCWPAATATVAWPTQPPTAVAPLLCWLLSSCCCIKSCYICCCTPAGHSIGKHCSANALQDWLNCRPSHLIKHLWARQYTQPSHQHSRGRGMGHAPIDVAGSMWFLLLLIAWMAQADP
jgi:hypothetical protein